jgi:hypothetical protein
MNFFDVERETTPCEFDRALAPVLDEDAARTDRENTGKNRRKHE